MTTLALLLLSGCAGPSAPGAPGAPVAQVPAPEEASYAQAVEQLRSGELIRRMNEDGAQLAHENADRGRAETSALADARRIEDEREEDDEDEWHDASNDLRGGDAPPDLASSIVVTGMDPCPQIIHPRPSAPEIEWITGLRQLGSCLDQWMVNARRVQNAITHLTKFRRSMTDKPFSKMTDEELELTLKTEGVPAGILGIDPLAGRTDEEAPRRRDVRDRFDRRELKEIARLARLYTQKLMVVQARSFETVDHHRALVEHFAQRNSRYRLLLLLRDSLRQGIKGKALAVRVAAMLHDEFGMRNPDFSNLPVAMLRPWAIAGAIPDRGREEMPLKDVENPFLLIQGAIAKMAGPQETIEHQQEQYLAALEAGSPKIPDHPAPSKDAVRVAVVDTGVDYVRYDALGKFLSNGADGAMSSFDFQDNDPNPYLTSYKGTGWHGSGVMASLLTVLANYAKDVLDERKLDLAMWKLDTVRDLLASPYVGMANWRSRDAMQEALIRMATDPTITLKPKIVSISAIFRLWPHLVNSGRSDAVRKAPWLWVMAAGNEGVPVSANAPICLGDVPKSYRIDSRILCVGAIKRDILGPRIASYSNYGDGVDLYAYESYIDICRNGTSCATPAITAAAAAVAARFPTLTPEDIRAVLLSSATRTLLEVAKADQPESASPLIAPMLPGSVRFNVLDPSSWTVMQDASNPTGAAPSDAPRWVLVLDPATAMSTIMEKAKARAEMWARSTKKPAQH